MSSWLLWMMLVAAVLSAGVMLLISGRRQQEQQRTRLDVNRELYEQRVAELEQEVRDGYLTEQAAQRSRNELDRRFVSENSALEQVNDQRVGGGLWLTAVLVMVLGAIGYGLFGSYGLQQQAIQASQQLPQLGPKVLPQIMGIGASAEVDLDPADIDQVALGLRLKLMREPDDAVAWMVYAELMTRFGQYEQAIEAYEKSYRLDNSRLSTLGSYARLLVTLGEDEQISRAARILRRMLELDPANLEGLSLLGVVAFQRGDWQQAVFAWNLLLQQLTDDDPRRAAIITAIADAEQQQRLAEQGIAVTVTITAAAAAQIPANASLFVYIRAPSGTAMPAAVIRQAVTEFPLTIRLSNANAMLDDYNLASLDQWQVMARISSDEQIEAGPGDLNATPQVVAAGTEAVELVIDVSAQGTD
ncbi:c-type cytochrome biogenesis protein CcmI [Pseudidiomarina mangrovi]|uniref:c-type cytochrome biogenesis protein CcmI n=1 Tax=Pseudidiomarina mangrovi TaxID=2487133 RepID=UPI000FCC6F80|nr:c-type cytochrome biogenesis protein CcmI [Pseudidiomarina mangrovi]CAI8155982.1 MAG: Cytochrome c-type biogenesis protein CcmH [Pseudidiomarina mangrovi]